MAIPMHCVTFHSVTGNSAPLSPGILAESTNHKWLRLLYRGSKDEQTRRSAAILFDCPAIRYGGCSIRVISITFQRISYKTLYKVFQLKASRGSVLGITTGYGLDD
jgi:hypothetical protein